MSMFDGLLDSLANSPAFQEAMKKFEEMRGGAINAASHFDVKLTQLETKLDYIVKEIGHIEYLLSVMVSNQAVVNEGIAPAAPCNFDNLQTNGIIDSINNSHEG